MTLSADPAETAKWAARVAASAERATLYVRDDIASTFTSSGPYACVLASTPRPEFGESAFGGENEVLQMTLYFATADLGEATIARRDEVVFARDETTWTVTRAARICLGAAWVADCVRHDTSRASGPAYDLSS